jgi:hypothetical protein
MAGMNNLTIISLLIAMTGISLWRSKARILRVLVVIVHLATLAQFSIYLSNVGRNTFEEVRRERAGPDTFAEGVIAEARAADAFAREQLSVVYVVVFCLGALALWPAVDWRRVHR